jgi:hypothetical protein
MARLRLSLYANDATVFVKPIKADVDLTMTILQRFDDATGLRINLQKSTVAPVFATELDEGSTEFYWHASSVSSDIFGAAKLPWPATHGPFSTTSGQSSNKISGLARQTNEYQWPKRIG